MKAGIRARYWISGASVLMGVALAAQGCSVGDLTIVRGSLERDGGAGSDPDSGAVAQANFGDQLAAAICENIGPCCAEASKPFDVADCEKAFLASVGAAPLPSSPHYDARAAGRCLDAYRSATASCFESVDLSACGLLAAPHGSLGDTCDSTCQLIGGQETCGGNTPPSVSCYRTDGLYCDLALPGGSIGTTGTCRALGKVGSPCSALPDTCQGSWCKDGTCAALLAPGQACTQSDSCRDGYCDASGTCAPTLPNGVSCATGGSFSCTSGYCGDQKVCASYVDSVFVKLYCTDGPHPTSTPADAGSLTPGAHDAGETCGDAVVERGEDCEGTNLGGQTCASVTMGALPTGTLTCRTDCKFDTSGCHNP